MRRGGAAGTTKLDATGCLDAVLRANRMSDWSFLVGHALGVDHVGHSAVLDSEFMHKKLIEVNAMLKDTIGMAINKIGSKTSSRPDETLFLFFGDHGMTESGSHGGGSSEEVRGERFNALGMTVFVSRGVATLFF